MGIQEFVGPAAERNSRTVPGASVDLGCGGFARLQKPPKSSEALPECLWDSIGPKFIESRLRKQLDVAPSTINRRLQLLHQAFVLGKDRGIVSVVPKIRHLSKPAESAKDSSRRPK